MATAKLQKFQTFTESLFPHEMDYLLGFARFQDDEKQAILKQIAHNAQPDTQFRPYDEKVDRRKYSYLLNWVTQKLDTISVDQQFKWMVNLEQQLLTDSLEPQTEKELLQAIQSYQRPLFHFVKLYQVAIHYQSYLLIRMRYREHQLVTAFLDKWRYEFERSQFVAARLHEVTEAITAAYTGNTPIPMQWEDFLRRTVYDDQLDGQNRDQATHRLAFLYTMAEEPQKWLEIFDYLDKMLKTGLYYSKRILAKYYANRLILHAKLGEWEQATQYGTLSIRYRGSEYLQHLTNLGAVLLRQGEHKNALTTLQDGIKALKTTQSYHDKTGFAAFYTKALVRNRKTTNAIRYAESFLRTHEIKQIFTQRWHIFFTSYLQALTEKEAFGEVLDLNRKYKLESHEADYAKRKSYLPHLAVYLQLAKYQEGKMSEDEFSSFLNTALGSVPERRQQKVEELLKELHKYVPRLVKID